ncbi:MAG TPA: LptF/LptG family permease [Bryobacteraceae bacterium]|nr:LptF/LptG family permease [Bryobacteraceae bacterium]
MRLLGRYVFREIVTSAVLGTLLATFVVFLHRINDLFALLVGAGHPGLRTGLELFLLAVPPLLPTTIPFGVLVGILIGLGRMAADGEIIAMRAAGVSSRKVILPVLLFATLGTALAGFASLRLTPLALRTSTDIINDLAKAQLSADIQPRVFDEDFPNKILYVDDVRIGNTTVWGGVFIVDVTPPEQRTNGLGEKASGPLITVAKSAIATSDPKNNRLQLSLFDYSTHEMGKDGKAQDVDSPRGEQVLYAKPPGEKTTTFAAMNTAELLRRYSGPDQVEDRIELHHRFTFPLACIVLAMVGIPLGISTRKGGKSAGYIIALFLGFFCYYLSSVTLVKVATARKLPVPVAMWLPDAVFFAVGLVFLYRMERPGDTDVMSGLKSAFAAVYEWGKARLVRSTAGPRLMNWRIPLLPGIVDTYVLSNFLFYVLVVLACFVSMTEVFVFLDLMGDYIHNHISMMKMATYLFFLIPELIYRLSPVSVLVGVLINFSVMTKHNEVTAFKACGVSLFRLAVPILIASALFAGGLFAFDFYYVPDANRKQDALRDEIKNRPKQTYLRPDRKWIMAEESRIYYYQYFDGQTMIGVDVFELEPRTFRLTRQILAERANWSASAKTWILENGWVRKFRENEPKPYEEFKVKPFPDLSETPDYFLTEALQEKQMNFRELDQYIRGLQQRGYDTVKLQVQFYRKFSVPLFALIMAMISVPFGFLVGNRGAMTGIGVSLAIGIAYLGLDPLFTQMGNVNQLSPTVAAWSPDLLFSLMGMYLLLRMRS